jgi:hypothetical protein
LKPIVSGFWNSPSTDCSPICRFTSRNGVDGYLGDSSVLEVRPFEIVSFTHDRLGDITDEEACAEGLTDLETYRALIIRMHRGMEWDPDHLVWVHRFREVL